MGQWVIEGPLGVDVTKAATTDREFELGTRVVTRDTASEKKYRIYRYCKSHAALTVGEIKVINSNFEATMAATATTASGATVQIPLGVAQTVATSATGALYGWLQTGGWFDNVGCINASANVQLFASATAGYAQAGNVGAQDKIVGLAGGDFAQSGTSLTADGFSKEEIFLEAYPGTTA